ncbi:hypothetical protein J6590_078291 [Homalodisca vitripennis]|nr:hypothetical protein J6590_081096 [Homalodisca vitripennis]KAG8324985.1 hypothetical protein J6590_078291 [Homalodisca vitripennis]
MHANSALALFTRGRDSIVTFHANLSGGVFDGHGGFAGHGGIVWLDGDDTTPGYTLTVQSATGAEALGTAAHMLGELSISHRVTIVGDNTLAVHNKLNVQYANKLTIINGATFTDKSTTSAKFANIHIGAASADVPTPPGPANYILDAVHSNFRLNMFGDNQITFDHADVQLTLRNSAVVDKTITLRNNLNPGGAYKGVVEFDSVVPTAELRIDGAGLSSGGNAVGLIFEGNSRVTGVVGTATSPVGSIQVQGTTVFDDKVQTANYQDIIISKEATAKFANSVKTRNIKGYAADQGTVQFSNAETIIVNSAIGASNAVDNLDIAGADVKITQAVSANYINFSYASKEATLTLEGINTVGGIRTNGNNVHTLALAADFTTELQDIGSENNRLKSIKLLGDHKITINSGVYSDVSNNTNNTGKIIFNSDRSFAYNLGTDKLGFSDITFAKNAKVRGDVYSKQITITSDKTATFAGTINRTISVPNFTVDGASISRSLKNFAYSTQIGSDEIKNESIAKFDKAVLVDAKITGGKVKFTDNVWFKQTANGKEVNFAADKFVILEQNISFANIKADKAKIIILPKTASITGNLAAKDLTVDLAANQLKYTGQAQLTGKIDLVTAYTSSGAGGNIEVQTGTKLDLSK